MGIGQRFKESNNSSDEEGGGMSKKFKERFKQVQEAKTKATRKVVLYYYSECGCGPADIPIIREVPIDSNIQEGSRTNVLMDTDIVM